VSNLSVALVGSLSLGNLTSFTLYSRRFSGPINQMSNIIADIQFALAAAERIFKVIDEDEEQKDDINAITYQDAKGNIELKDVSLKANQGQVVAIVGPTGAGKTTLVNLLMRFYEIDQGEILLDKIPITKLTRSSLRRSFSMVLQDTWIFHGTVYENIAYGNGKVSRLEVEEAAKKARIHSFIKHLPEGYDTILTDEGLSISKGQKQLLVIARAMLSRTKMLILDEATSNVDTHTEVQIQQAMLNLMKNKTTFVIAHRLSTIQNADLILVVNEGNIVEQGNHQELINQKGFYFELYQSQFA